MLKKCGIAVVLLLMVISLTVGSMGSAMGQSPNGGIFIEKPPKHTVVILDLSSGEGQPQAMWNPHGLHVEPGTDGAYVQGRMIVREAGSDIQRAFPVKFYRHGPVPGKPFLESYRTSVAYTNGSEVPYFTLDSELALTNGSVESDCSAALGYDNVITTGQTVWHQAHVYSSTSLSVDLKWNNPADDLRLMIYTPDGHILGPYYDGSDGKSDGRISLEVDNQAGVAAGAWSFKVMGISVTGKDEYYLRVW
ncbi:hypothetical protein [Methanocella conradii]|uniref:hypothetical protein n=1 Tax=Methanocella conradii TaxID=1175444 RepID=UPI0024B38E91|nr:hypothetical protein [Methanocella conradii]MDI6897939.1 hypothetical protein [Methanocella conradii]